MVELAIFILTLHGPTTNYVHSLRNKGIGHIAMYQSNSTLQSIVSPPPPKDIKFCTEMNNNEKVFKKHTFSLNTTFGY